MSERNTHVTREKSFLIRNNTNGIEGEVTLFWQKKKTTKNTRWKINSKI